MSRQLVVRTLWDGFTESGKEERPGGVDKSPFQGLKSLRVKTPENVKGNGAEEGFGGWERKANSGAMGRILS